MKMLIAIFLLGFTSVSAGMPVLIITQSGTVNPKYIDDLDRMVQAVCKIEGGEWAELGGAGCMTRATWADRTKLPYSASRYADTALPVYRDHVLWLIAGLVRAGLPASPENVYLCWRRGLTGGVQRIKAGRISDAAKRCGNLFRNEVTEN